MLTRCVAFIYDRPVPFVLLWFSTVLMSIAVLVNSARLDVNIEKLLGEDSPVYQDYRKFTDMFGSDEYFLLLVSSPDALLDSKGVRSIQALRQEIITTVPQVARVYSFLDTPMAWQQALPGEAFTVNREPLTTWVLGNVLSPPPVNAEEQDKRLQLLKGTLKEMPAMMSPDGHSTLMLVSLKREVSAADGRVTPIGPLDYLYIQGKLETIAEHYRQQGVDVQVAGQAAFMGLARRVLVQELFVLPIASLGVSVLCLLLIFQRFTAVILPALCMLIPALVPMALMSAMGIAVQLPLALLPSAMVVISVASVVHILAYLYRDLATTMDTRQALLAAFTQKSQSLWMTTLTTVVGFLSFYAGSLESVVRLGMFGALGSLLSLLSLVLVSPLYVRIFPMAPLQGGQQEAGGVLTGVFNHILDQCAEIAIRYPGRMVLAALVLMVVVSQQAMHVRFAHDPLEWMPHHWQTYRTTKTIDHDFHVGTQVEIVLDSGKPDGVFEADFLRTVNDVNAIIDNMPEGMLPAGLRISLLDYMERPRRLLGGPAIADDTGKRESQWARRDIQMLRLGAPAVANTLLTDNNRYTRITLRLPVKDGAVYREGIELLAKQVHEKIKPPYHAIITGQASVFAATQGSLAASALYSFLVSLLLIAIMMTIHLRNVVTGLWLMIPNILPVVMVVAGMTWLDIPMDLFTIMVVSISLGIVVDDTVHFSGSFRENLLKTGDPETSVKLTLQQEGRALITTTLVLTLGWQMLLLSEFDKIKLFGNLICVIMVAGLLADLVLAPAILVWLAKFRINRAVQ